MNKVWLVIENYVARYEGDYDSTDVDKIFATKEAAEAYLEGKPRILTPPLPDKEPE